MLLLFLSCMVLMASAGEEHTHEDVGEYGHYNTWRKAVCEKNDQEMYKEMDKCFKLEQKTVQDAAVQCAKEADPASDGEIVTFVNDACKDKSLFIKFDSCFEEYEANPEFRKQMDITPEIEQCYEEIFEKHAMETLQKYLKEIRPSHT